MVQALNVNEASLGGADSQQSSSVSGPLTESQSKPSTYDYASEVQDGENRAFVSGLDLQPIRRKPQSNFDCESSEMSDD